MSIKPPFSAATAIGAIRLALEGGKDDETRLAMVWQIIDDTEATGSGTESVSALLYAFRKGDFKFEVMP